MCMPQGLASPAPAEKGPLSSQKVPRPTGSPGTEDNWLICYLVLRPPVLARLMPAPGLQEPDQSWF